VATVPVETYEVPKQSKLRDLVGESADVIHARFKHNRSFVSAFKDIFPATAKRMGNYLAARCQKPDYPQELFTATWSLELLYPHLPKRFLNQLPQNLGTVQKFHIALVETEQLFVQSPEFGVIDPPMVAFNKASAIYNSIIHKRSGGVVDTRAVHKPTYEGDEGKPPVIIRGTQVWPAETGAGYCYDDLRCAWGLAEDVIKTFDETPNAPISTRSLKLRHLMAWLGGYNSVGATIEGTIRALRVVVSAYSADHSSEMRTPHIRMDKVESF
jgi:hypothetical protein